MNDRTRPDTVFLHDLRIETVIGIWDWERKIRQTVSIDLEMGADVRHAAAHDDIEHTLDYKAVAKRIQSLVGDAEFNLVETMAERIAEVVLTEFNVPWVQVRVNKPGAIRNARDVGVSIFRSKD